MRSKLIQTLFAALVAVLGPIAALAQADPALEAYQQGTAAFNSGNFGDASAAFRRAMELRPTWKIRYNIAQCEASLRHYDLALEEFEAYLVGGGDDVPQERQAEVLGEIERLRMLVATVELKGAQSGEVYINGVSRGELPEASRLKATAGVVEIIIRQGDETVLIRKLKVTGGDTVRLDLNLGAENQGKPSESIVVAAELPAPQPLPSQPEVRAVSKTRAVGWILVGLGAATLVVGSGMGGAALSQSSKVQDQCIDGHCPASAKSDADKARGLALGADVCFGVGAAMAIIGGLLGFGLFSKSETAQAAWAPIEGGGMFVISGRL